MIVEANAKINLTLDIVGKRNDGYHNIDTIMQKIDIADQIEITKTKTGKIKLTCSKLMLPTDERNLAYRAAQKIFRYCGMKDVGVNIHLVKNIPAEAGMGGGSADAAAVLKGINELFNLHLSTDDLIYIGAKIGADVPFCIVGGTKRCTGIGDVLEEVPAMPKCAIMICKPDVGVSTKDAYNACDMYPQEDCVSTIDMVKALEKGDLLEVCNNISNRFDDVLHIPEVEIIKATMISHGAIKASMTGSGSAVFGIFPTDANTKELKQILKPLGKTFICNAVD